MRLYLLEVFSERTLASFKRDELQDFLERKVGSGLGFSTVDHLRWDLHQIFRMAVTEEYLRSLPTTLLFTPREAVRKPKRRMNWKEVWSCFSALELRELLIAMLAVLVGMRPGEIFALQWGHMFSDHIDVRQRLYEGKIDTPKTRHSQRQVALSEDLSQQVEAWKSISRDTSPEAWVFPSEAVETPLKPENCWRRNFQPHLEAIGLDWLNFQVMRRTHASLMRELEVDPKIVADQLGHTLDVSMNVYTDSGLALRGEAVNLLSQALRAKGPESSKIN